MQLCWLMMEREFFRSISTVSLTTCRQRLGGELTCSNPRILKTTLIIYYIIQIKPPPSHHPHDPHSSRLPEYLGRRHLGSTQSGLQSPNERLEGRLCLCKRCGREELRDGCQRTCESLFCRVECLSRCILIPGIDLRTQCRHDDHRNAATKFVSLIIYAFHSY